MDIQHADQRQDKRTKEVEDETTKLVLFRGAAHVAKALAKLCEAHPELKEHFIRELTKVEA